MSTVDSRFSNAAIGDGRSHVLTTIGRVAIFLVTPFVVCAELIGAHPIGGSLLALCAGGIAFAIYEEWQGRRITRAVARQFKANCAQVKYSAWWEGVKRCAAAAGYRSMFFGDDARANLLHESFRAYHRRGLTADEALREWESDAS